MFKKLRNKFLILNMAIISVLILSAFSVVYITTYNQTQRNIEMRLRRMQNNFQRNRFFTPPHNNADNFRDNQPMPLSVDFTIELDDENQILSVNSVFDIEDDVYNHIVQSAIKSKKTFGDLKYGDSNWAFLKITFENENTLIKGVDVTREKAMLKNLVFTFAGVGILALFVIFLISLFFANRSIKPIEDAWEKQNQFIANASHELKTPLTTINTNVDVLLAQPDSSIQEERKWLEYIKAETERMTRLTNNLLYLAKLDTSSEQIIKSDFSLSETISNILLAMEAVIYEKNLILEDNIESEIWITANSDQIKQLCMILLDNAIKYSSQNGKITVKLHKKDKTTSLSVANEGEPIPLEIQQKIFDRFYRADLSRSRESGGYGLGLSIAKTICMQNNALIKVSSKDNINTFTVIFN